MRPWPALAILVLSGCFSPGAGEAPPGPGASAWPYPGGDLASTRYAPDAALDAADLGDLGLAWRFQTDGAVTGTPTVSNGRVFFGTWQGSIYAVDLETGRQLWHRAHGAQVDASITIWNSTAYVGDMAGRLTALDAATGTQSWNTTVDATTSAHLYSSPVVWPGEVPTVVIGVASDQESIRIHGDRPVDFRGNVAAFDARTGSPLWRTYLVPEDHTGAPVWGGVAITGDTVLFGTGNAYTAPAADTTDAIMALDVRTGAVRWSHQATQGDVFTQANPINPDHDFGSTPSVFLVDGRMVVAIGQKSSVVWALDVATGDLVWTHGEIQGGEGIIGDAASADGLLIVNHATQQSTTAINTTTGQTVWRQEGDASRFSDPAVLPGAVIVGDGMGQVMAYGLPDGRMLWNTTTGDGGVFGGISIAGDRILVPTVGSDFLSDQAAVLAFAPGGAPTTASPTSGPSGNVVELKDFRFVPEEITVRAGDPVRWVNADGIDHTATSGWDNGTTFDFDVGADQTASFVFTEPGTYRVYCRPHAYYDAEWKGMVGTVVVE